MKKLVLSRLIGLIAIVGGLGIGSASCQRSSVSILKYDIAQSSKELPISFGDVGEIDKLEYDDDSNSVNMYFAINPEYMTMEQMRESEPHLLNMFKSLFSQDSSKDMLDMMVDADASMNLIFRNPGNPDNTFTISLDVDDLKVMKDNSLSEDEMIEDIIANQIKIENAKCPQMIEEGITLVGVSDNGDYVTYKCTMDEELFDMSLIESGKDIMKESIAESFADEDLQEMIDLYISLNKGIKYDLIGSDSREKTEIIFTPQDLRKYLRSI